MISVERVSLQKPGCFLNRCVQMWEKKPWSGSLYAPAWKCQSQEGLGLVLSAHPVASSFAFFLASTKVAGIMSLLLGCVQENEGK